MYKNTKKDSQVRILHCPENLGNNAKRLSDFEKSLGIKSWSISLRKEAFGFEADQTLVKSGSFVFGEFARWRLLWIAISKYDVIHFNNGKTIMPQRVPFVSVRRRSNTFIAGLYSIYAWVFEGKDLFILKFFGKKIYFTYQGSDARLSSHYTKLHPREVLDGLNPDYLAPKSDRYKLRRIVRTELYADAIYCLNPDLLRNFSQKARFVPYYNVDLNQITPHSIFMNSTVHIVHAPSKRDIKGSKYIIKAIEKITQENSRIRFTLVEGMSNSDAQKIYDTADLFIDQLIVGWYGGVAVELMARGVPVMCFLEDTSDLVQLKSFGALLPIISTSIPTIENDLRALLARKDSEIRLLGQSGYEFTKIHHIINI